MTTAERRHQVRITELRRYWRDEVFIRQWFRWRQLPGVNIETAYGALKGMARHCFS